MKRICIDASLYNKTDGTGRVTYNLLPELLTLKATDEKYYILFYKKNYLPDNKDKNITVVVSKFSGKSPIRVLWYVCYLPLFLFFHKIDIYYSFENFTMPPFFRGKSIITVHDLIPIKIKNYYRKLLNRTWFTYKVHLSTKKVREAIVVSEFSETELLYYFPIFKDHTHVVYNALDMRLKDKVVNNSYESEFHLSDKGYFFATGGLEKRKNNILTIRSYIRLLQKDSTVSIDLVIMGVGNQAYANASIGENIDIPDEYKNRIHLLGRLSDEELASLYEHCFVFIFPSTYEGFGMPVLEAMYHHAPVICSDSSSLPEVVGDSALRIEDSDDAMLAAMESLISDNNLRQTLVTKGENQVTKFSWGDGAKTIHSLFR